ncbi:carbamate kinase [Konateibacter massiliensis]|uniref:carbamate kinase n=1 Tax=Konateibacter massiliensis TaxID=2002841 RepID=UPI000C1556B5|nr:carbamate kinase [Konateibacter massiliensis]
MAKKKVVVALGREAFGAKIPDQKKAVKRAANAIADLVEAKYQVVITHSNGPQVGMLHTAMTEFSRLDNEYSVAPMSVCGALSQGYIGYDLQNAIRSELLERGIFKPVSTIITQVRVDPFDDAFNHPTKEIGRYMSKEEADEEIKKGNYVTETKKGFRRIVATPKPVDIYEIDAIKALSDANQLVIACGGGGIPVLEQGTTLRGASAVIEKDSATAKLADMLDADTILFLTGVEKVALHYQTPEETWLDTITTKEAEEYVKEGHFPETSMLPKIEASIDFVGKKAGRKAIITHLDKAKEGIGEKTGTIIIS